MYAQKHDLVDGQTDGADNRKLEKLSTNRPIATLRKGPIAVEDEILNHRCCEAEGVLNREERSAQ